MGVCVWKGGMGEMNIILIQFELQKKAVIFIFTARRDFFTSIIKSLHEMYEGKYENYSK